VDIRLRPLREDEFADFYELLRREYVRGMVDEAGMTPERAEEKAAADYASVFPDRAPQPHHRIYIVEDAATRERTGHLFWAPRQPPGSTGMRAYLYELYIDEAFRGQGLGRRALELFETDARDEGLPGIDLNVWGDNQTARRLYRSAGFSERAVFMSKELE
jgi:ribosomal protein S18 acetylase RimI-like enzyme